MAILTVDWNKEIKNDGKGKRYEVIQRFKMPRIGTIVFAGFEFHERNDGWYAIFDVKGKQQFYTISSENLDKYINNLKEITACPIPNQ